MDMQENVQDGNSLTMRDYVRVLFRQKMVIVVSMITVILTAFLGLKMQTKVYEARVKMLISAEKSLESPFYKETLGARNVEQTLTQSEIVTSDPVLMRVVLAQALNKRPLDDEKRFASPLRGKMIELETNMLITKLKSLNNQQQEALLFRRAKELLKRAIKVEPVRDTNMFNITVRDYDPIGAAILANTVSRAYVIFDLEQQLAELRLKYGDKHPKVLYLIENITKMEKTLDGQPLQDIDAIGPASVKIIEQASVPLEPTGMPKAIIFLMAILMSIFLGIMLAFIFEYADQTIKTPRDIDQTIGVPILGSLRRRAWLEPVLIDFDGRETAYTHSYATVCDHLYLLLKDQGMSSLLLTTATKAEDSFAPIVNMANYISGVLKHRVLVIEADLRGAGMHKIFKVSGGKGLADYLDGKSNTNDITHQLNENLAFIPAGSTDVNAILLFESTRMSELMAQARKDYDLIIIRSAALRNHKDPAILSRLVDGVIVLCEEGKVRRQVLQTAFTEVRAKARHIIGALLVNRNYPVPRWIYDRI